MINYYKLFSTTILWCLVQKAICVIVVFRNLVNDVPLIISSDGFQCLWYYRHPLGDNGRLLTNVAGSALRLYNGSDLGEYFCWEKPSDIDILAFVHRGT